MIGVTVGIGPDKAAAEEACRRFREYTGLQTKVLGDTEMTEAGVDIPHMLKLCCFDFVDDDRVCYFDADLWFQRSWDPEQFAPGVFWSTRDLLFARHIIHDAVAWGIHPDRYFNSGLMIMDRGHDHILKEAGRIQKSLGTVLGQGFVDQSAINLAVQISDVPMGFMDRRYNWVQSAGIWLQQGVPIIGAHKYKAGQTTADMFKTPVAYREMGIRIEQEDFDTLSGVYEYERVGHDKRYIQLCSDGNIGLGVDRLEQWWLPLRTGRGTEIMLYGYESDAKLHNESEICRVVQESTGVFQGQWLRFEQMPVTLRKVSWETVHGATGVAQDLISILRKRPKGRRSVAELGVGDARVSSAILKDISDAEVTMIDAWSAEGYTTHPYPGLVMSENRTLAQNISAQHIKAMRRTMFAGARRTVIMKDSESAFYKFPRNYFDMIYIAVGDMRKTSGWWGKLRQGGVLAGPRTGSAFLSGTPETFARAYGVDCCMEYENIWYVVKGN